MSRRTLMPKVKIFCFKIKSGMIKENSSMPNVGVVSDITALIQYVRLFLYTDEPESFEVFIAIPVLFFPHFGQRSYFCSVST